MKLASIFADPNIQDDRLPCLNMRELIKASGKMVHKKKSYCSRTPNLNPHEDVSLIKGKIQLGLKFSKPNSKEQIIIHQCKIFNKGREHGRNKSHHIAGSNASPKADHSHLPTSRKMIDCDNLRAVNKDNNWGNKVNRPEGNFKGRRNFSSKPSKKQGGDTNCEKIQRIEFETKPIFKKAETGFLLTANKKFKEEAAENLKSISAAPIFLTRGQGQIQAPSHVMAKIRKAQPEDVQSLNYDLKLKPSLLKDEGSRKDIKSKKDLIKDQEPKKKSSVKFMKADYMDRKIDQESPTFAKKDDNLNTNNISPKAKVLFGNEILSSVKTKLSSCSAKDSFEVWYESAKKEEQPPQLPEKFWQLFKYRYINFPNFKELIDDRNLLLFTENLTGIDYTKEIMEWRKEVETKKAGFKRDLDENRGILDMQSTMLKFKSGLDQQVPKKKFKES